MQNSHPIITYAYHFLSEAIIIFLITLSILHHRLHWVPYWSYLAVIIGTCIVFSIISRYTTNYAWYLLSAPVLFGVFYILNYPMELAVIFSVLLVWRYTDIRKEEVISRENVYILLTILLTAINSIFVNDSLVMLYPFLQFVILIIGYIGSHLAVVKKEERKQFDFKLSLYFVGILALGAGLFFVLYDYVRMVFILVWDGLMALFTGALHALSGILSLLEIEKREFPEEESQSGVAEGEGDWEKLQELNFIEAFTFFVVTAIALFFLGFACFYLWKLFKKHFSREISEEPYQEGISYLSIDDQGRQMNWSLKNSLKRYLKRPSHPIRKMVLQLEQKAAKSKKGRMEYETVEDWLARIGLDIDLAIYQKVRYGETDVSEQEVGYLKAQLKEIELNLEL